jgi:hypothetical protein
MHDASNVGWNWAQSFPKLKVRRNSLRQLEQLESSILKCQELFGFRAQVDNAAFALSAERGATPPTESDRRFTISSLESSREVASVFISDCICDFTDRLISGHEILRRALHAQTCDVFKRW